MLYFPRAIRAILESITGSGDLVILRGGGRMAFRSQQTDNFSIVWLHRVLPQTKKKYHITIMSTTRSEVCPQDTKIRDFCHIASSVT